ncbi:unnamed protein product [Rotaria magnacalcarata]|uniref:DUF4704 domain-containing protein n=1 Tax=Rotaria magnacalcarata TaxID=392030 RepID=A0A820HB51_9BILA|nr:unnamed protein product [Rotaria magnacalcarata]CAF4290720.1 unnamed protein product [Rotaria magnacalcarata]
MSEYSRTIVPAFDRQQGLKTVFKLLASSSEIIRLQALKLLGFFLQRSTVRLLLHPNSFTMATYNVLFEIPVEKVSGLVVEKRTSEITADWKIENPGKLFYKIMFCGFQRFYKISVWQDYLFDLPYFYSTQEIQTVITDRVFDLLKILLHHAIKFEYGGWRALIDTLSILHGRINKMVENMKDDDDNEPKPPVSSKNLSGTQTPVDEHSVATPTKSTSYRQVFETSQLLPFTISEFKYSPMHIHLLPSVFDSIEIDMTNVLCNACGGLLPVLTSATSANNEIELLENTEGLSSKDALNILKRVMSLSDLFILANSGNFAEH